MSVLVPAEVRRLFQVLTGEDMTDADEDALFEVAGALESGAATVETLGPVVGDVVGRVRGGFSGKAADRFAQRLEAFGPVLESGGVGLRELAGFVRNLALQVQYLKFVTVGGLLLLLGEVVWAVSMAGLTAGASMAWLAARFAVMRFLLSRWWGQLFMRLAVAQIVGIGLQVVIDGGAHVVQFALGTRKKWDGQLTEMAVGVGSFSALLAVPLSALGNVVGNAITKVLVRGLGDEIDAEVLAAAAKHAAEEHAQQYPVSSMARFADVASKCLDDYTGMSVRAMWSARFGHGLGESLEEGLTEMFGESGYGALSGQGAQWNPFSFTAGLSEAVGSGIGNIAGLALRGGLTPVGRARDIAGGEKDSGSGGARTDTEATGDLKVESGSQPGEKPGSLETRGERSGSPNGLSGVDSGVPVPGVFETPKDAGLSSWYKGDATALGALRDQERPGPPPYSTFPGDDHIRGDVDSLGDYPAISPVHEGEVTAGDAGVGAPPEYGALAHGDHAEARSSGMASQNDYQRDTAMPDDAVTAKNSRTDTPLRDDRLSIGVPGIPVDGVRVAEPAARVPESLVGGSVTDPSDVPGVASDSVVSETIFPVAGVVPVAEDGIMLPEQGAAWDGAAVPSVGAGTSVNSVAGNVESADPASGVPPSLLAEWSVSPDASGAVVSGGPELGVEPVRLPAGSVRVSVPVDVVSGGEVVEFVRGRVGGAGASPVVLVSGKGPGVVSWVQASELARGLGRDVVAVMPGRGPHGPRWMRFDPDGSRPRPIDGPSRTGTTPKRLSEGRDWLDSLANSSTTVPPVEPVRVDADADSTARDTVVPESGMQGHAEGSPVSAGVTGWTVSYLRRAVERAHAAGGPPDVAVRIVQGTHDVVTLARGDADLSLDDVIALVAAKSGEAGRAEAVRFSRELAARLGTEGTGLAVHAGAEQDQVTDFPGSGEVAESGQVGGMAAGLVEVPMTWGLDPAAPELTEDTVWWFDPETAEQAWEPARDIEDPGANTADPAVASEVEPVVGVEVVEPVVGVEAVERSRLVAELTASVNALQGLLPGAPEGYLPGLRQRVELWSAMLGRQGFDGVELAGFRQRVNLAGALVERVRRELNIHRSPDLLPVLGLGLGPGAAELSGADSDRGVGETNPIAESSGRKRGRSDDVVDEGAERRLAGPGGTSGKRSRDRQLREDAVAEARRARSAGEPYTGKELGKKFGRNERWGRARLAELRRDADGSGPESDDSEQVREEARAEARRAQDAGRPHTGVALGHRFGKSDWWGLARIQEMRDAGNRSSPDLDEQVREQARVEARRARDAGEPYTGKALGTKFGKGSSWGLARLREIRDGGEGSGPELGDPKQMRAEAWVEARRARDAGEPYTGLALGEKFGKSERWGSSRLAEIKDEGDVSRPELNEQVREEARVEARCARDAGEPYTGLELAKKFGKSRAWGLARLAEIKYEGVASRQDLGEQVRAEARVEARRARDAGEPYTGLELAKKFGKSHSWGSARLAEIKDEGVASRQDLGEQVRAEARVEARRARDAGEPYTGLELAKKFGKSRAWGSARLAEIKDEGDVSRQDLAEQVREEARVEARRARDAGEPYTGLELAKKFGKSRAWGSARLAEINDAGAAQGSGSGVSAGTGGLEPQLFSDLMAVAEWTQTDPRADFPDLEV
ncbi:WXG100-like domain-containing protein [Saccharopolyspora phatthalungensis]|uniref:Outer membrane channel protein CpnT-like N-terminal domain-containing protein n=1 Tax=Saccharopolyspora phatthalungensis TaxID=664693 RepID=A0A840QFS3_9PSEU|nr:hypothetical protein [Saccharopolyspora phatthalungensis]MBB5158937.1 hypothetical protein [Saccharopolyspora phatthalungensis]